jgi:hypothetical protein
MSDALIPCVFDGNAFVPTTPFLLRLARERYGEGEIISLGIEHERSKKTHDHQFAMIEELWQNLPEALAQMPYAKSAEALRKHALVECGYTDCETIDAGSKAAAERVAAYLSRLATLAHGYAIVKISGPVVRCYTPQSQSFRAMGKKTFQESKEAVLGWVEALLAEQGAPVTAPERVA